MIHAIVVGVLLCALILEKVFKHCYINSLRPEVGTTYRLICNKTPATDCAKVRVERVGKRSVRIRFIEDDGKPVTDGRYDVMHIIAFADHYTKVKADE